MSTASDEEGTMSDLLHLPTWFYWWFAADMLSLAGILWFTEDKAEDKEEKN